MTLAIDGGRPVFKKPLPFHKPTLDEKEVANIADTLDSGWLTYGDKCRDFEDKIKKIINVKNCVAMSSATDAISAAIRFLRQPEDDSIQCSDMTFVSVANAIERSGMKTKLLDITPMTMNINSKQIQRSPIITVNYGGNRTLYHDIRKRGEEHFIIEDAAHSFGDPLIKKYADAIAFSFYATKNITTGTGGALCWQGSKMDEDEVREHCLHGLTTSAIKRYKTGKSDYDMKNVGANCLMNDIQASIGLAQLKKYRPMQDRRNEIAKKYNKKLVKSNLIRLPSLYNTNKVYHLYPVLARHGMKEYVVDALKAEGVMTSSHFKPIHRFEYYQNTYGHTDEDFPLASMTYDREISLPIYPSMTDEDVRLVIKAIDKIEEHTDGL